ncbi:hypothetical protein L345_11264, partial [Ophiophagus hannah]
MVHLVKFLQYPIAVPNGGIQTPAGYSSSLLTAQAVENEREKACPFLSRKPAPGWNLHPQKLHIEIRLSHVGYIAKWGRAPLERRKVIPSRPAGSQEALGAQTNQPSTDTERSTTFTRHSEEKKAKGTKRPELHLSGNQYQCHLRLPGSACTPRDTMAWKALGRGNNLKGGGHVAVAAILTFLTYKHTHQVAQQRKEDGTQSHLCGHASPSQTYLHCTCVLREGEKGLKRAKNQLGGKEGCCASMHGGAYCIVGASACVCACFWHTATKSEIRQGLPSAEINTINELLEIMCVLSPSPTAPHLHIGAPVPTLVEGPKGVCPVCRIEIGAGSDGIFSILGWVAALALGERILREVVEPRQKRKSTAQVT